MKYKFPCNRIIMLVMIVLLDGWSANASPILPSRPPALKTGYWRAVLQRTDGQQIVFNFATEKKNGRLVLYVINDKERLLVDSMVQKGDSLFIQMPFFASGFNVRIQPNGNLVGEYIKQNGNSSYRIAFHATYGSTVRYAPAKQPRYNIAGKWKVIFVSDSGSERYAVGEFQQKAKGKISGTVLTPSGDYRYLEGIMSGDSMKLSAFDGGHAVLFSAKLDNDSTISEAFLFSGLKSRQKWTAKKDSLAALPDSYQLTKMRPGETTLNFSFISTTGDRVSINDERYKNKVVIVQIMGSWCPNCMDETAFLSKFYKENRDRGIEIVGLAYERTEDIETSKGSLIPFQKRFDVQYPFLITGVTVSDELKTEKTLPQIDKIKAFPTTIFIGKDGKVSKIHTGFNGPGTGEHYEEFKREFNKEIQSLLSAKP